MKDRFRDLFTFSSGERKGIAVLVFILIVICIVNMLMLRHQGEPIQNKYPGWMKDTTAFEIENLAYFNKDTFSDPYPPEPPFAKDKAIIDPNSASLEQLLLTGFSLRISRTILNYRQKGGKFRVPEDLKKIYGLTPEMYRSVAMQIWIPGKPALPEAPAFRSSGRINLNTADSALLVGLPGIGPVLARRITRYRSLLGGYYSCEQIREVYGVTDSLYLIISDRLEADTACIRKINLNTSGENDLARHPYIGKYSAAGILQYRAHVGTIMKTNELLVNGLLSKDHYILLKYYLSL